MSLPTQIDVKIFFKNGHINRIWKKEVRLVLNFVYSKLGRYFFMLQETCSKAAQCTRVFIREKYKICSMKLKTLKWGIIGIYGIALFSRFQCIVCHSSSSLHSSTDWLKVSKVLWKWNNHLNGFSMGKFSRVYNVHR